jgi:dihydropteroate synthase
VKDNNFYHKSTVRLKGNLRFLDEALIMGILNVTPDSFFDGGKFDAIETAVQQATQMLNDGGALIDVGGYSSRPGATPVSEGDELQRVIPVIKALTAAFPEAIISIDTFRSTVAEAAVQAGAAIINDISGGNQDPKMFSTVAKLQVPYILMHMQGDPQTMQQAPEYGNVVREVHHFFSSKLNELRQLGVADVILDPGFGFGKTLAHNYQILNALDEFNLLGCPILAGVSRKSMINKVLGTKPENALNGTTVVNTMALQKGAQILRVHDVKEAVQAVKIVSFAQTQQAH